MPLSRHSAEEFGIDHDRTGASYLKPPVAADGGIFIPNLNKKNPRTTRMQLQEKRTHLLPAIRSTEILEITLMRLANQNDRSLSDYMRHVLERHCFGHVISVDDASEERNQSRA